MGIHQRIEATKGAVSALPAGLERDFGSEAGGALAKRFLEAETVDFHWEARLQERWLGGYDSLEEDGIELDRVAIMGWSGGSWFVAICVVDGEGQPHAMSGCRTFGRRLDAAKALAIAH